jgi:hypothetical protein
VLARGVGQPIQRGRLAAGKPDKERDTILCHGADDSESYLSIASPTLICSRR